MTKPGSSLSRFLREPLVQFLVLGALLFLLFNWRGSGSGSNRIVITPGQIDSLAATFSRTWQRPPSDEELKGQIDDYVREEIATREAMAMGLDRDDTVIRRRLRQKLEFLAEDTIDQTPPTDAELQAWLDAHPEAFRVEPELAFRQVYFSRDRRGASVDEDARRLRDTLERAGADAAIADLGDRIMLPQEVDRSPRTEIARQFGEEFADAVLALEPGRWSGPVQSSFGVHVVFVREKVQGRLPPLADVRPAVDREFTADRRRRQLESMYEGLLANYRVVIEKRVEAPPAAGATPPAQGGSR